MINLKWYGNASVELESGGKKVVFDPFGRMQFHGAKKPLPYESEFREIIDVFVTHGHFDHIYHIPGLYRDRYVNIYCTDAPYKKLSAKGMKREQLVRIKPGDIVERGPFSVAAYKGTHCKFDMPLIIGKVFNAGTWRRLWTAVRLILMQAVYREKNETIFYEVVCGGKRIQIMGSMNLDSNFEYPKGADVLVLPFQGRSDRDTYAVEIVRKLMPKSILLDHYDDAFPPITERIDTTAFVKNVREMFGIECTPLNKNKIYTI